MTAVCKFCALFLFFLVFSGYDNIGCTKINNGQSLVIDYKTLYYNQKVDHFGFANEDSFQQRYLLAEQYWDKDNDGPIFFYTGNEGDIDWFCNNTGALWEWAPEFKALLVFAEHRYYGESMPYGNKSYDDAKMLNYLTAEQALADFAILISHLKESLPGASHSPVVAFGGSYGGMLSAWFRMKYPQTVIGALAASAPIWMFGDLVPCASYYEIVTKDFKNSGPNCAENIAQSWKVINKFGASEEGRAFLSEAFGFCEPMKGANETQAVKDWLSETWSNLAMVQYPYAASFLEPLPAWPIKVVCEKLSGSDLSDHDLILALRQAVDVYFNYTGNTQCYKTSSQATAALGDRGWGVQSCTEMVMPICTHGVGDMFEPSPWDLPKVISNCQKEYGFTPRPDWIIENFGGKNISAHSNIIFSNGLLDPWSSGGVMESISDTLVAIVIEEGAHHLDLRNSNPDDPPSVIKAREKEKSIIRDWIKEYKGKKKQEEAPMHHRPEAALADDDALDDETDISDITHDQSGNTVLLVVVGLVLAVVVVAGLYMALNNRKSCQSWLRQQRLKSPRQTSPQDEDQYTTLL